MTPRHSFRIALIVLLCLALSKSSSADQLHTVAVRDVTLAAVGVATVVVVVVVLVRQSGQSRTITGCVNAVPNGLIITDEKDKRAYALTGNLPDVKSDERMKLRLKKIKNKSSKVVTWETVKISKDFGACKP